MKLIDKKIEIILPPQISIIYWLNSDDYNTLHVKIYNSTKELNLCFNINKNLISFDKWSNTIILKKNGSEEIINEIIKIENSINTFLKSWDIFIFSKIKFKGKGFRIKFLKRLKLVKFFFGRSHKTFIFFKKIKIKKINKYKFILKHLKKDNLFKTLNIITNIKSINYYTLRGLRISRQIIYKRKGKKGTYI